MSKPEDTYYAGSVFRVRTVDEAKRIILTPSGGHTAEERWERETPYLVAMIAARLGLSPASTVLDYGCGIGRMAKGLIGATGCAIVGVDISPDMRALAKDYVGSPRFAAYSPEAFRYQVKEGLRVGGAISIWVLQHVAEPGVMLDDISAALSPGGRFFLVNDHIRHVPTNKGWLNDGIDQRALVAARFSELDTGGLPEGVVSEDRRERSFWALYERRP